MESSGGVDKNFKKRQNKRNKKPESGDRSASGERNWCKFFIYHFGVY